MCLLKLDVADHNAVLFNGAGDTIHVIIIVVNGVLTDGDGDKCAAFKVDADVDCVGVADL